MNPLGRVLVAAAALAFVVLVVIWALALRAAGVRPVSWLRAWARRRRLREQLPGARVQIEGKRSPLRLIGADRSDRVRRRAS